MNSSSAPAGRPPPAADAAPVPTTSAVPPDQTGRRGWLRRLLLPAPVTRVGLFFLADDMTAVVSVLGRLGVCQLERVDGDLDKYLHPCFPDAYRDAYRRLHEPFEFLSQRWHPGEEVVAEPPAPQVPTETRLRERAAELAGYRERADTIDIRQRQRARQQTDLEQFAYYLRALAELQIDVRALANLRFLQLRAGTVPSENLSRLQESAALGKSLILSLGRQQELAHVLVVGTEGPTPDLEGLLAKANFQPMNVPAPLQGAGADAVRERVEAELLGVRAALDGLRAQDEELAREARPAVQEAAALTAHAAVLIQCAGTLRGRPPVAFLSGWVEQDRLGELEEALARDVPDPVALVHLSGPADDPWAGPSPLAVPVLFRPGSTLVTLFGTPGRTELNPALVLAVTAPVFFGMMFGDVGQGLLLTGLALAGRRRLGQWLAPALACGLSSTLFGLLYGSVFGVEHWVRPLWLSPLGEPFRLLAAALWVGVAFLLLTFVLQAINLGLRGRWPAALLSVEGGAGALCYLGGVSGLRALYRGDPVPPAAWALLGAGSAAVAAHLVLGVLREGRGALTELASELFHGLLSMMTNTLSFLRLAAFALNHGALSLVLYLLVGMLPTTPLGWVLRGLALVGGSALILALDVLVVAVQTVRLEFYEGLTRYFRGEGKEFLPLRFPGVKAP